jgi:hypothetical protein
VNDRYPGDHQAIRRAWAPHVPGTPCARCGVPIAPGQAWDLDHDDDRAGYRGPAHASCNRRAGGRLGVARRAARRHARTERITRMTAECVLGVEISEQRHRTAVCAAAELPDGMVAVELVVYLVGADAVSAILELREARTVLAVVVDPHAPAATLIRPLTDAGVKVTEPASSDLVVAHGDFLDGLAAGRLRHAGQPELTAAVRHAGPRRLGGAEALERRGNPVDVSPAVAAELAVWGLAHRPAPPPTPWVMYA